MMNARFNIFNIFQYFPIIIQWPGANARLMTISNAAFIISLIGYLHIDDQLGYHITVSGNSYLIIGRVLLMLKRIFADNLEENAVDIYVYLNIVNKILNNLQTVFLSDLKKNALQANN